MTLDSSSAAHGSHTIAVAGLSLVFQDITIPENATGSQVATAAGFEPGQKVTVLKVLPHGELEDVNLDAEVDLHEPTRKFVVVPNDRAFRFTIDSTPFDWPVRIISGGQLRKLGHV
ncbi:MAG TPA: multiubiquitin domain-containing protein, partial [Terriglobales bacterium]|nr:multiubiquitin domain-containing protein [Terriglobales bacterium]